MSKKLTYKKSGVNIRAADNFVKFISLQTKKSKKRGTNNIGSFASLTKISKNYKKPYLATSTDGVGTKIEIANTFNKFDTIGVDLVAMCVNDLIVQGAKPLVFLDYISINKIDQKKLKSILKGIITGCNISGCQLVGGETAEMPGTYAKGKFDIAGFSVGIVDEKNIIINKIKKNNIILAVPSNGLHSNGFSLVRHVLKVKKINIKNSNFFKKELLKPTAIYVKEIMRLNKHNLINGCANITGGGLVDNIKRVIPKNLTAEIDLNTIKVPKIFKWLKSMGVSNDQMLKTFNCGVGFCIIVEKSKINSVQKIFSKKYKPYYIGKILSSKNKVSLNGKINW